MRECLLRPEEHCIECGECSYCDLDQSKICTNCCRCLGDSDYNAVEITEIIVPKEIKLKSKRLSSKK